MAVAKRKAYEPRQIVQQTLAEYEMDLIINRQRQARGEARQRRLVNLMLAACVSVAPVCAWLWWSGNQWASSTTEFAVCLLIGYVYFRLKL